MESLWTVKSVLLEEYDFEALKQLVLMQSLDMPFTYADTSALETDLGGIPFTMLRDGLRIFAQLDKGFYQV